VKNILIKAPMSKSTTVTTDLELVILTINSKYDAITRSASRYREQSLFLYLEEKFRVEHMTGQMARRQHVTYSLENHGKGIVYISGIGHGYPDEFTGELRCSIFKVGEYSGKEVNNKIVHLLSCSTASILGKNMVEQGCKAFFGYDQPFLYVDLQEYEDIFWDCDAEIDRAFIDGCSAAQAHERTIEYYNGLIQKYSELYIQSFLDDEITVQQAAVYKKVFTHLQDNLLHLCSPAINPCWGSSEITLLKCI
jgi:hypothetical protein